MRAVASPSCARRRPARRWGRGRSWASVNASFRSGGRSRPRRRISRPAAASPNGPVTKIRSPTSAPARRSIWAAGTRPVRVTVTMRPPGEATVSPPITATPYSRAAWARPAANSRAPRRSRSGGQPRDSRAVPRVSAHGGDVAQVHRQGLPAQLGQGGVGQIEVDALHQGIHGPQEIIGAGNLDGGAVVADAQDDPGRGGAELPAQGGDEVPFAGEGIFRAASLYCFEKFKVQSSRFKVQSAGCPRTLSGLRSRPRICRDRLGAHRCIWLFRFGCHGSGATGLGPGQEPLRRSSR